MITVFGSTNLDQIGTVSRLPRPGETVAGGTFSMAAGGKGANQALAARRAGAVLGFLRGADTPVRRLCLVAILLVLSMPGAAACGTVTASAIMGTASEPKPAPKPLLLMPSSSTAGTATA